MLEGVTNRRLSGPDLEDLARLERTVTAADGISLKLEWPYLREGRTVAALTHRDGGCLTGFLGLYCFGGPPDVEFIGMVDPERRRHGIAGQLLDEALDICRRRGLQRRLLIVPRDSGSGRAFATGRGAELEHSEHSLLLTGEVHRVPEDPKVTLRDAVDADRRDLVRILTSGFGPPPEGMLEHLQESRSQTLIVHHAEVPVGTVRVSLDAGEGGVHGFAIDTAYRGRGIGRDVLSRVCTELRRRGARQVRLEVAVENDAALHLYTSTGFTPAGTDDYFLLPPA
jgi:ribosomal protein S18 acetylase RimI-like enzyme